MVAEQAGGVLRRIMLVVLVATLMALVMAASAMPALAKGGDNFGGNGEGQGGGIGGSSPTKGSEQGVSKKDKDYQGGVYNNPHRPVVVVVDDPFPPTI
jgi:opacity protein-like surface antigen